ncbi:unnamed protein product, partial [Brenthis ino]
MKLLRILLVLTIIWIQISQNLAKNEESDVIQNGHIAVPRNVLQNHQPNSDENIKSDIRRYKKYKKDANYRLRRRGIYETDEILDDNLFDSYLPKKTYKGPKERLNKTPTKLLKLDDNQVQLLKFGTDPKAIYLYLPFEMTKTNIF